MFADTIVLSRELSLRHSEEKSPMTSKRSKSKGPSGNLVEIEIFGHESFVYMAVSGNVI